MRKMKDSGIEWIGEIPEEWEVVKVGRLFNITAGGDAKLEYYSEVQDETHPFPVYTNSLSRNKVYAYTSQPVFTEKTITVTGRGAIGTAFYRDTPYDAIIRLLSLSPKFDLDGRFYAYWIGNVMLFFTDSAAIGQLSAIQMASYKTVYCSKIEQSMIADFLDKKCAAIDEAVNKTRASIEEYKKLKQSLITQAVTKGLRPHRPMKPSGIEWIGDIPEEWGVIKIKSCVSKVGSGKTPLGGAEAYTTEGILFLRSQNVYDTGLVLDNPTYITKEVDEDMRNTRVLPSDVLLNITGGSIGRCCIFPSYLGNANVNQHVSIIRVIKNIVIPEFMHYYWLSNLGHISIHLYQTGGNREGMTADAIKNSFIPFPPLAEQQEIADYLDKKCAEIDALIAKKEALAKELEACKKSLIYEYVTGKTYCK